MYKQKRVIFLFFYIYFVFGTRFFVAANGVVCFMSVLTLIFNLLMRQQTPQRKDYYFLLFLVDLVSFIFLFLILHAQKIIYMSETRKLQVHVKMFSYAIYRDGFSHENFPNTVFACISFFYVTFF